MEFPCGNFNRHLYSLNRLGLLERLRLIPPRLTVAQTSIIYASEADLLNVALFGSTAAQWRQANPDQAGNMRDAATLEQLVVLSNLESINAVLIHQSLAGSERLVQLNAIAITQMRSLVGIGTLKQLSDSSTGKRIKP